MWPFLLELREHDSFDIILTTLHIIYYIFVDKRKKFTIIDNVQVFLHADGTGHKAAAHAKGA